MKRVPLLFPFFLALLATLLGPWRLCTFAPFLALSYNRLTFPHALFASLGCGLLLDLLSFTPRFGLHACTFVLTSALLYRQKRHVFEDKSLAIGLFSAVISSCLTLLELLALQLLSWKTLLTDVLLLPLLDGVFGILWFVPAMRLYAYVQKIGLRTLLHKLQHTFQKNEAP